MKKDELTIKNEIRRDLGRRWDVTLFTNPVGRAWAGPAPCEYCRIQMRPLDFGLCGGSCDLIGWQIRNGIAVFIGMEVKQPGKDPTDEQVIFINNVNRAGGVAGVVRSIEDARKLIA